MNNPIFKKLATPIQSTGPRECPCCGFNTNLLPDEEKKVDSNGNCYCRLCVFGRSKRKVTVRDFYELFFDQFNNPDAVKKDFLTPKKQLPSRELAHLCGGKYKGYIYLDMYYDLEDRRVYFRLCCSDDDESEDWSVGTETYMYVSISDTISLLNKNDIHFLDGLDDETVFDFVIAKNYLIKK